jgi:hypothetical protein
MGAMGEHLNRVVDDQPPKLSLCPTTPYRLFAIAHVGMALDCD